jgi:transposase
VIYVEAAVVSGPGGGLDDLPEDFYRRRNVVERCFNWLKQFSGLATRYAKWEYTLRGDGAGLRWQASFAARRSRWMSRSSFASNR